MIKIEPKNYEKFILDGQLALECYNDLTGKNADLINEYYDLLKEYRSRSSKTLSDKEKVINKLIYVIEKIGMDNFNIYEDGMEYNLIKRG